MKELVFHVEFLSDIVLPATSNTEGKIDHLDFIAGSNFLGMVAQKYDDFKDSFTVFHSGKVRFGDAHILKNEKLPTYKVPYSYVHEKLENERIYNHHTLTPDDFKTLGQLKQLRSGYITKEKELVFIDYSYSQKSAYDKENRKSLDSTMYGYKAIKKGSMWQLVVKVDGSIVPEDEKLMVETLQTSSRLGKSKSAEYGQVKITHLADQARENISEKDLPLNEVILYCNSRVALLDESGNPTYELKHLCEGLKEEQIAYEKTQIRTSTFTPYNTKRQTKDYERVCIKKGSVIVLKDISDAQLKQIQQGVGAYLSEGFGEIIINPSFLMEKGFTFASNEPEEVKKDERQKITQTFTDSTIQFLVNRHNTTIDTLRIAKNVADFIKNHKAEFKNINSSQWGNIRSIASSNQNDFIEKIKGYIGSGSKKWETHQVETLVKAMDHDAINKQTFIKLLAMKMGGKNDE
ncbi:hypothetical protein FA592_03015 [Sulfurospirillum diekertiae]|uniref:Uncharacterized protein n=1 Tax=Sulfurospirillum diekertiae TaxID=1854492 RepID=A0A6G9VQN1_9BACT|nr:hypothetical protein [Sulfurospirillum diekertiae]QIR75252.1 hypothetical protein FA584_03115 [Sulfurospirillum diekertiae]QIR77903.1 hypothetical protein FA592_03015 [Sulfurospirillum diekertiae]